MRKAVFCFVILAGVILAGCAPDPRNQADADKTRILAEQAAADRQQARNQAQAVFISKQAEQEQTSAARVLATDRFITWVSLAGAVGLCVVILSGAVGASWGIVGAGRAAARAAELRANLIPLPDSTRQYPLLIQYNGRGRFSLANPNTGAVTLLDTSSPADRQALALMAGVQVAGIVEGVHHGRE